MGAPPRADRRHRPRLRPARDADLAAAREADPDRADVPLRPAAGRAVPPVLAVRRRGDRRPGPGRGRRDRRAGDALLPRGRAGRRGGVAQLDRRPGLPPGLHRGADRVLPGPRRRPAADRARAAGAQPAAPPRFEGPGDGGAQRRRPEDHRPPVRGVRRPLRGASRRTSRPSGSGSGSSRAWSAASTTTRGPPSSSTSSGARASSRRSAAADATTGSSSCSAGGRRPGSGSGSGSTASSSPSPQPGSRPMAARRPRSRSWSARTRTTPRRGW